MVRPCREDGEVSIVKRVYVGESAGSRLVDMPRKRWNDTVKECLKKDV